MKMLTFILLHLVLVCPAFAINQTYWEDIYSYDQLKPTTEKIAADLVDRRFELDIDQNGLVDHFLGVTCGNGGCVYHIYIQISKNQYHYIGPVHLHQHGFEVMASSHNGMPDILTYWHMSSVLGILSRNQFDGRQYRTVESYEVDSKLFNLLNVTPITNHIQLR